MTNTDKTRQKLVNSMRKSKDAAAKRPAPKTASTITTSAGKKISKKSKSAGATPATAAIRNRTPTKSRSTVVESRRGGAGDPYQSGRRIWPD